MQEEVEEDLSGARHGSEGDIALLGGLEVGVDLLPVHHIPERRDVLRPPVLVLQVVRLRGSGSGSSASVLMQCCSTEGGHFV